MFTGIVTEVGKVSARQALSAGVRLTLEAPATAPRLSLGSSVAVNGVCQTVVSLASTTFQVEAVGATLERTTLGRLTEGRAVNLEPSLRIGDELGGHLVMGHVDGLGTIASIVPRADAIYLKVKLDADLARFAAPRGSLAVDGVSLTVAAVDLDTVTFSLIPHTVAHTIARSYGVGDSVNLEVDLLARYLDRLLAARTEDAGGGETGRPFKETLS